MPTQEISRSNWPEFFHGFTRGHQGWLATIEVFGSEIGAQVEARRLSFEGIAADSGEDRITLTVGRKPDLHLTHMVTGPTHVRLDQTEEGAKESLQIESAGETTTLVRLQPPIFPDLTDDVILE